MSITPADPSQSSFKRNVSATLKGISDDINKMNFNFEHHAYNALGNSPIGETTSLYQHLDYRYTFKAAEALADHNYCHGLFDKIKNITEITKSKSEYINSAIDRVLHQNVNIQQPHSDKNHITDLTAETKVIQDIEHQIKQGNSVITLNLHNLKPVSPMLVANHNNVIQNSLLWHEIRRYKITGSRLAVLLGLHGKDKFVKYWDLVKNGLQESDVVNTNLLNFKRGHMYEQEAINYFEKLSNSSTERCGFFVFTGDDRYGSSPDAIAVANILLEIKTRAKGCDGPLDNLVKCPSYFVQVQLQMMCTDSNYTIVESYSPEKKIANFFLVKKHNVPLDVMKCVTDSILTNIPIPNWPHTEHKKLKMLGELILGRIPNFETLSSLRSLIKDHCKTLPKVQFI